MLGFKSCLLNVPRMVQDAKHRNAIRRDGVIQNVPGRGWPTAYTLRQLRARPTHQWLCRKDAGFTFEEVGVAKTVPPTFDRLLETRSARFSKAGYARPALTSASM